MENNLVSNRKSYTYDDGSNINEGDIIQICNGTFTANSGHRMFGLVYLLDEKYYIWQFYQISHGNFECNNLTFNEFLQNIKSNEISFSKLTNIYDYDILPKDRKLNELDYFSLLTKLREIMHIIMPLRKVADSASKATNSLQQFANALKDMQNTNYYFVGALDENHNHYRYTKKLY